MTGHLALMCGHLWRQLDAVNYEPGTCIEVQCEVKIPSWNGAWQVCGATSWLVSCGRIMGAGDLGWHVVSMPSEAGTSYVSGIDHE